MLFVRTTSDWLEITISVVFSSRPTACQQTLELEQVIKLISLHHLIIS